MRAVRQTEGDRGCRIERIRKVLIKNAYHWNM